VAQERKYSQAGCICKSEYEPENVGEEVIERLGVKNNVQINFRPSQTAGQF
jgi:hypothetical protein